MPGMNTVIHRTPVFNKKSVNPVSLKFFRVWQMDAKESHHMQKLSQLNLRNAEIKAAEKHMSET